MSDLTLMWFFAGVAAGALFMWVKTEIELHKANQLIGKMSFICDAMKHAIEAGKIIDNPNYVEPTTNEQTKDNRAN